MKLVRTLYNKENYISHDRDDLYYYGIKKGEYLFGNFVDDYYYKPILVKSSFKDIYKYYESRGDKDKNLSVKEYLNMIIPYFIDLINDYKAFGNESNE